MVIFLSYHDRAIWRSGEQPCCSPDLPIIRSPDYQDRRSRRVPSTILAVVDDLLFLSKIQQTAQHVGVAVKSAQPADLPGLAIQDVPNALLIDLNHRSGKALEVLRTLKSDLKTKEIAAIGFVSHVQNDLIAAARDAGCDLVLARSAFVSQLPSLLQRFSGTGTAGRTAE